jgi:zinc protease
MALAVPALGQSQHMAQSSDRVFPFEYRRLDLDNGLRSYLIRAGAPGQIAYVTVVRTGSRDEVEPGRTGFAHFFEHMMFRGTEKYPNYDAVTEAMGSERNANTSNDRTVYHMVAASEYLPEIIDLESDRFRNLSYDEAGFRTEAGAVLGEFQNSAAEPFRVLDRELREVAFSKHTYGHTTIGFEADIRAMPEAYDYSLSFYQRFYRPENCVVLVVGDFDFDETEALIRSHYSEWKPGYVPPAVPQEPEQTEARDKHVEYPGRTLPIVSINYKAPAWNAEDRLAVATEVLGSVAFGPNSETYKKLVIDQQRVQFLLDDFQLARDPALVGVTTMVSDPSDTDAVRQELLDAVERYRSEPIDPELLARTKSYLKYSFLMGLETARDVAMALLTTVINTGAIEPIETYFQVLDAVTPEDLANAAQKVLAPERRTIVVMTQKEASS